MSQTELAEMMNDIEALDHYHTLENGTKVVTYSDNVLDIVGLGVEHIKNLLNVYLNEIEEGEFSVFHGITTTVVEDLERKVEKAEDFIREHHGRTEIRRIMYNQDGAEGGKMVKVVFTPAHKKASEEPRQEATPEA